MFFRRPRDGPIRRRHSLIGSPVITSHQTSPVFDLTLTVWGVLVRDFVRHPTVWVSLLFSCWTEDLVWGRVPQRGRSLLITQYSGHRVWTGLMGGAGDLTVVKEGGPAFSVVSVCPLLHTLFAAVTAGSLPSRGGSGPTSCLRESRVWGQMLDWP